MVTRMKCRQVSFVASLEGPMGAFVVVWTTGIGEESGRRGGRGVLAMVWRHMEDRTHEKTL